MHLVKFSSAQHYWTGSLTRPGTGNFVRLHCQPVVTGGPLLLELSIKHAGHVPQSEGTDSRAADWVGRSSEDSVQNRLWSITIATLGLEDHYVFARPTLFALVIDIPVLDLIYLEFHRSRKDSSQGWNSWAELSGMKSTLHWDSSFLPGQSCRPSPPERTQICHSSCTPLRLETRGLEINCM